ncbi:MAG: hypothetical protein KAR42_00725 [candidate division Zixibacteria bacterium]|nr:hypothetical protein [candidate division Zixibacteria bacterium]
MKTISIKALIAVSGLIIALIASGSGCGKKPTDPPPPPEEHLFYVASRLADNRSIVKTFSVEQEAFIDSFTIDSFEVYDMAVVGNDEKLILAGRTGVRFYDLTRKEIILSTIEYCCLIQTSVNSEYYKSFADGTKLFRTDNYQEFYFDTSSFGSGHFCYNSEYYIYNKDSNVVSYNINGDSIEHSFKLTRNGSLFRVYNIWPTVDMKKLFLIGNQGHLLYFAVTDFGKDSVRVLQAPLRTWGEDAAVSPDGRYIYFVNTPYTDAEMPRMKIDVYDVETEQLVTSITTLVQDFWEPEHIALTSDGKYLMATPWSMGGYHILLIDAKGFKVIGSYQFGDQTIPETVCTKK